MKKIFKITKQEGLEAYRRAYEDLYDIAIEDKIEYEEELKIPLTIAFHNRHCPNKFEDCLIHNPATINKLNT